MNPAPRSTTPILLLVVAALIITIGCDSDPGIPGGELVFEDDFERQEIGDDWSTDFDGWHIDDDAVQVQGAHNDALWLDRPLPDNFRVSFTAQSDSSGGDIKFEVLADGQDNKTGYIGIFGGWNNSLNIIARLDEHGDDRLEGASDQRVEPGRTYQMDVVRTDHRLRWYVDGDLFLSYDDSDPLQGPDHRYFGFNNWESPLTFDNVRVYDVADSQ